MFSRALRGAMEAIFLAGLALVPCVWSFRALDFTHARMTALCGFLILLALLRVAVPYGSGIHPKALWIAGGATGWMLLATAGNSAFPNGLSLAADRLPRALPVLMFILLAADCRAGHRARHIPAALTAGGLMITGLVFGQYFGWLNRWFPSFPNYDQAVYSVFGNQNFLGGYLAVCAGAALGAATAAAVNGHSQGNARKKMVGWLLVAGILYAGILLSASRTALLALGGAMAVALYQIRTHQPMLGSARQISAAKNRALGTVMISAAAGLLVAAAVTPNLTVKIAHSFSAADQGWWVRRWLWEGAIRLWLAHPLTGIGWNRFAYESPAVLGEILWTSAFPFQGNTLLADTAHSELLQLLAETSLVGTLALASGAVLMLKRWPPDPMALPGLAALGIFCLFNSPLRDPAFGLAGTALLLMHSGTGPSAAPPKQTHALFPASYRWIGRIALSMAAVLCAGWVIGTQVIPGLHLRRALDLHTAGQPEQSLAEYRIAARRGAPGIRSLALENFALALYETGRAENAVAVTGDALSAGWNTGRLYWIRALASEGCGNASEAERSAAACLRRWPFYGPAWELLLRNAPAERRAAWQQRLDWWRQRKLDSDRSSAP